MRLGGMDGLFRCIGAMKIWGHNLEIRFPYFHDDLAIFLDCFVVKHIEVHRMSPFTEARHDTSVGHNAVSVMEGLKGFNQYGVAAAMEYEHDVAVARSGVDGKPADVIVI